MKITRIEVSYDSGHHLQRMGAGPRHLIQSGLDERLGALGHAVDGISCELGPGFHTEATAGVALMRQVAIAARRACAGGRLPVILSGNCGAAVGTVTALGAARTGVLWFDAHGDLCTPETTLTGFFDGMGYAMLLGEGWRSLAATVPGFSALPAENAALIGARDLDPGERMLLDRTAVLELSVARLRSDEGRAALEAFARRVDRLYVHVDLDALDPAVIRANYLPTPDGLSVDDITSAVRLAANHAPIGAVGLASYDPAEDDRDPGPDIAVSLLQPLLRGAAG